MDLGQFIAAPQEEKRRKCTDQAKQIHLLIERMSSLQCDQKSTILLVKEFIVNSMTLQESGSIRNEEFLRLLTLLVKACVISNGLMEGIALVYAFQQASVE